MSYTQIGWQNKPSTATPINRTNLNHMDAGIAANDAAIGTLNTAVQGKVDKVEGKGLSTNDFTDADALKLAGIEDGAQVNVQADWDEADNTADDFIKNKPDLGVYAEKDSLWQDATVSGNPVTLKTQSAQAAKQTIITMAPIQDLHGYSKPWAPGASDQLLDESSAEQGTIDQTTGEDSPSANVMRTDFMPTKGATSLFLTADNSMRFFWYNSSKTYLSNDACSKNAYIAVPNNAAYFRVVGINSIFTNPIMINAGTIAKTYCPYANICPITGRTGAEIVVKDEDDVTQDTVTISFGQTVYGGTLNVETGELTVDTMRVELDTLNWAASSAPIVFFADDDLSEFIGAGRTIIACDSFQSVDNVSGLGGARSNPNNSICGFSGSGSHRVYIRADAYSTKEALVAALDGVYACYKLATPTTTTLTAAQVNLLKGLNNVSTDADGISLTYFADGESLTDADNRITAVLGDIATVEGARASQNYAIGDYLIFSDKFCKASAAIASGEVLAIGTNLTQTTIGAELKAILAQLL